MEPVWLIFLLAFIIICWRMLALARKPTHAGGVVYRTQNGVQEFLLVTSLKNKTRWVLPKGRIEQNENEMQAALREVAEEAGVNAAIVRKAMNVQHFKNFFTPIHVAFYLMEYKSETSTSEKRKLLWLPLEKAIQKISVAAQRKVLKTL